MNFQFNKYGCKASETLPPELEKLIDERIRQRKERGCWNPQSALCDCPACGGFND